MVACSRTIAAIEAILLSESNPITKCSFNDQHENRGMAIITANIDNKVVAKFRHVIYNKHGLKKGDVKQALEEAMLDYIQKYSERSSRVNRLAATAKTITPEMPEGAVYNELRELGADVDRIKRLNPTQTQLNGLLYGLKRLHSVKRK
jgi:hypothetical protein